MSGSAPIIIITEKQQSVLSEFAVSRTISVSLAQRSKIVLMAFDRVHNDEIAVAAKQIKANKGTHVLFAYLAGWLISSEHVESFGASSLSYFHRRRIPREVVLFKSRGDV
jgi:hypothetical protein